MRPIEPRTFVFQELASPSVCVRWWRRRSPGSLKLRGQPGKEHFSGYSSQRSTVTHQIHRVERRFFLLDAENANERVNGSSAAISSEENDIVVRAAILHIRGLTNRYGVADNASRLLSEAARLNANEGGGSVRV